jgi:hypothetical protein
MNLESIDLNKTELDIIEALSCFKVLPSRSLLGLLEGVKYRQSLDFYLTKLKKHGYLNSRIDETSHKTSYYFLTALGVKKTGKEYLRPLDDSQFYHELYLSRILLWLSTFHNLKIEDRVEVTFEKGILPDASFNASKNQTKLRFAIEAELTQKEKSRYESKVIDYNSSEFSGVFYFCKTRTIQNAVSTAVENFANLHPENPNIRSRFVFMELPDKFSRTKFCDFNYKRDSRTGALSDLVKGLV